MASGYAAGPASPPRADPPRHPVAGVGRTSIAETLDDAWGLTEDRPPSEQASLWLDRGREDLPIVSEPSLYKSRACRDTTLALNELHQPQRGEGDLQGRIDNLRDMATGDSDYIDLESVKTRGGGIY
jgi:hypothetical protein